jgi:aspartate/methionine/tyrosine aminotransferase
MTFKSRGFKPELNQILVTQGGNIQIYYVMACIVDPGEEVITIDPCFVSYKSIMNILGITPVFIPLHEENGFKVNPEDIERAITPKTKMILINSPHNPTGSVLNEAEIFAIYQIAKKYDLYLVSDEVYGRMVYDDEQTKFHSPSKYDQCKDRTVVIHSFSKSYAMTGWRIGAITGPASLVEKMSLLLEATTSCVSPFIQEAAIEAMTSSQGVVNEMMSEYRRRRDLMVGYLNKIQGVSCILPHGAFYAFANIKKTGMDDIEFSRYLLDEAGVATCPGSYFGSAGKGFVRFCFANSIENINRGMLRVQELFETK